MNRVVLRLDSSLQVQKFTYPAGERQVRITDTWVEFLKGTDQVIVPVFIKSTQDIIDLALLKSAIDGVTKAQCVLAIPYFPYARADRRFKEGDCEGLLTFVRLLFAMSWDHIITLDVHSEVTTNSIANITNMSADPYIRVAIENFAIRYDLHKLTVVLPDAGAAKRYNIPRYFGSNVYNIEVDTVVCEKKRDPVTGKLLGFSVPVLDKPAILVDDLCDAGGTFLGIASEIAKNSHVTRLGLYVTHGIFSKGFDELKRNFSKIYTTDSYFDGSNGEVYRIGCWLDLYDKIGELNAKVRNSTQSS